MSDQSSDHVVMEGNTFVCLHCGPGQNYKMNLPCPINVMTAAMNAYVLTHKYCQKTSIPT